MKRMKKLAAVGMVFVVILFCMGFTQQMDAVQLEAERAMTLQEEALDAYQLLWDSFEKDPESLQPYYPDEYGGEYIDGDKLVIQLTENTPENQAKYRELCGNSDKVVFEKVTYSLNYLNSLESQAELLSKDYAVTSYGVRRSENKFILEVEQDDLDAVQQHLLRQRSSVPIEVRAGVPMETTASLVGGGDIYAENNAIDYSFSLGICGTYDGSPAFLTCGHDLGPDVSIYSSASHTTKIGKVAYWNYGYGKTGDYSIVKVTNSNFTTTNKVKGNGTTLYVNGSVSSPEGTTICKYGKTTGYSSGKVTATNLTFSNVKGITQSYIRNSSKTTPVAGGDSGGSVYVMSGSYCKITGLVSGRPIEPTMTDGYMVMYHTPILYAVDNQGFKVKTN